MKAPETIPLSSPDITELEIAAVVNVLRSPRLSLGPVLSEFEASVSKYVSAAHAVAVSSGTSGLDLALLALGITEGDEVIVPSFTFIAAANVIRYVRATPVFADIDPVTLNLNPSSVEAAITPRTRAIMVVHTFGLPADLGALFDIARRHNLRVIEDACEALGAEYDGSKVGPLGDVGVFAFYPNKQITTGEGGVLVTRDPEIAATARSLRNQGRRDSEDWFEHEEVGYNYRISEVNCALGVEQMKRIEAILLERERVAQQYERALSSHPDLILPVSKLPDRKVSWFVYVVRLNDHFTATDRDFVMRDLDAGGVQCGRYFAPVHLQPAYRDYRSSDDHLAVTVSESARTIALPFFNRLTPIQIQRVSSCLLQSLEKLHRSGI